MGVTSHHLKTGRNDLCPCGSGKKYKKCCMMASGDILDFSWHQIRQTEGELVSDILLPYVNSHLPRDVMETAFEEFKAGEEAPEDLEKLLFPTLFIPWFLFAWIPRMDYVPPKEIGLQYLEKRGSRLTPYQKRVLEAFCQSYYSFYYVLDVEPEKSVHLKDIFLGIEHTIKEKQGTHFLQRGHIIFSSLVTVDNQCISISILPYTLSSHHLALIDIKNALKKMMGRKNLTPAMMRSVDNELRGWALRTIVRDMNNPLPEMRNTDNDPMEFCRVYFKLMITPEEALSKLLPLTLAQTSDEILEDAKRDKQGQVEKIEFSWLKKGNEKIKSWSNTVLGHITIDTRKMTIDVNSRARADKIQALIKTLLHEGAVYQNTVIKTLDQVTSSPQPISSKPLDSLSDLPEVRAHLQRIGQQHWQSWIDEPLPALEDKTPRKAALTAKGREKLEALLLDFEAHNARRPNDPMNPDVDYLKTELKLC